MLSKLKQLLRREAAAAPPGDEAGTEWRVLSASRLQESRDGQVLEYPGRMAECPHGHRRVIPTRFDQATVALTCAQCQRKYTLRQG